MGIETPATGGETGIEQSQSLSPGFGNWTTANGSKPALLTVTATAVTDGSSTAGIVAEVDESGGTSPDYVQPIALADPGLGSNGRSGGATTIPLKTAAQFRVVNQVNPTGTNSLDFVRAYPLE